MNSRRDFLIFLGRSALVAGALPSLPACISTSDKRTNGPLAWKGLSPSTKDDLILAEGMQYEILLRSSQVINSRGDKFGYNPDYLAFLPLDPRNPYEGLLWVNHEYHDPYFTSGWRPGQPRTAAQVEMDRKAVGGSINHIRKLEGQWRLVGDSKYNRRLDAFTKIPFVSERPILGHTEAIGTFANCAGGVTPWGTVLSCEENYDNFVGEVSFVNGERKVRSGEYPLSWTDHVKLPPEHYGWVVEVNLKTGKAKKLTSLGRFAHEGATCSLAPDGRTVVYTADDADNEHLYKFISDKPGSLERGTLYVANTEKGIWIPLSRRLDDRLKKAFTDQTELLIRAREAAKIVGATPLDRPEDIEIDPLTGAIVVALTNNKKAGRPFGSLMKIVEKDGNPLSLEFQATTWLAGSPETGFACPDNLCFDRQGNLWLTTDISGASTWKEPYQSFGNNSLFMIPAKGEAAGQALRMANAPVGAEFTGPMFSSDGKTLFLSVQHPGERFYDKGFKSSHWPDGGDAQPTPCVVTISGPALEAITNPSV